MDRTILPKSSELAPLFGGERGFDPGIAFILTDEEREKAKEVMQHVFGNFLGEWVGVREGEDVGNEGPVYSTRHYYIAQGGPQVWCTVTAGTVGAPDFYDALKALFWSPTMDNVLTFFFEDGGNVQIFELDKEAANENKLVWQEIMRTDNLFRVVEAITDDDRLIVTIYRQDDDGKYQVYAKGTSRRKES